MSALPPKADISGCGWHVRFVPNSGHCDTHSITSSARESSIDGTVSPSALAVLRLTTNSNLVVRSIGRSAG
jgi:hypothetical protein